MFGLGKVLGKVAGGFLDNLGLGKITPFVKMGLNAMTGNWMGVAKDVFSLVSNFKSNFLDKASSQPPLGNFQQSSTKGSPLSSNRMGQLLNMFERLFGGMEKPTGTNKILNAFNIIKGIFDNYRLFDNQANRSNFANMKM